MAHVEVESGLRAEGGRTESFHRIWGRGAVPPGLVKAASATPAARALVRWLTGRYLGMGKTAVELWTDGDVLMQPSWAGRCHGRDQSREKTPCAWELALWNCCLRRFAYLSAQRTWAFMAAVVPLVPRGGCQGQNRLSSPVATAYASKRSIPRCWD